MRARAFLPCLKAGASRAEEGEQGQQPAQQRRACGYEAGAGQHPAKVSPARIL
jgi:hypothetical protein